MTGALTREQAEAAAATAAAERDAIQANLLDLDGSLGKRLLAGATLTGESRTRWAAAEVRLAALWELFTAYSAVVDGAVDAVASSHRSAARLAAATALLTEASVQLAGGSSPLAERGLTGTGEVRLTLAAAVRDMKLAFADVVGVVTAAENVWNEVTDELQRASTDLAEARQQAGGLADDALNGALAAADASLSQLRDLLNTDPLALWQGGRVDTARLERLRRQAAAVVAQAAELQRLRADADRRIAAAAKTVAAARGAREDAAAALDRAAAKIAAAAPPGPLPDVDGLAGRLAGLNGLKAAGRWARLASELDVIENQAAAVAGQCREAERSALALLDRRDELRGLLDAYRARAAEEQLKLIDMGGVRRIDDDDSPIYGTVGYQAPEIETDGPSPSSDLYTVGRALAVLTFEFTGYQGKYAHALPDPATVPLLAEQESFLRALRRATDPDPGRRFASAGEMADQLTGVLREVLAVADERPRPAFSVLFSPELQAIGVAATWAGSAAPGTQVRPQASQVVAGLPVPQVDSSDPAVGYLATLSALDPAQLTAALAAAADGAQGTPAAVAESAETRLALARARIVTGDLAGAETVLAELAAADPDDWRVGWYAGLRELAAERHASARAAFDAACDALPGELAPKLALGFAAEATADLAAATRYFRRVWTVDRSYVSAAFGLARARLQADDRAGAVAALAAVPETSSHYVAAQIAVLGIRLAPGRGQSYVSADDLRDADARLGLLKLDDALREQLTTEVLRAALNSALAGQPLGSGRLAGCELTERALRFGLEKGYRALARLAPDRRRRIELVDLANYVRPRTWS